MSFGRSSNSSSSRPLTPNEVASYFSTLNNWSGGQLSKWATTGNPAVAYNKLTPDQIKQLGGLGETRRSTLTRDRNQENSKVEADPSLSTYQRMRAKQLNNQDYQDRIAAINKETEAAIQELASTENQRTYDAKLTESERKQRYLSALSNIFFGGGGTVSSSSAKGFNIGI